MNGYESDILENIRRMAERGRADALERGGLDYVDMFQHILDSYGEIKAQEPDFGGFSNIGAGSGD